MFIHTVERCFSASQIVYKALGLPWYVFSVISESFSSSSAVFRLAGTGESLTHPSNHLNLRPRTKDDDEEDWERVLNTYLPWDRLLAIVVRMSEEPEPQTSEERAWQYFLQLQPSIADVNAAAELAFRAVDAFDRVLKRKRAQDT